MPARKRITIKRSQVIQLTAKVVVYQTDGIRRRMPRSRVRITDG